MQGISLNGFTVMFVLSFRMSPAGEESRKMFVLIRQAERLLCAWLQLGIEKSGFNIRNACSLENEVEEVRLNGFDFCRFSIYMPNPIPSLASRRINFQMGF